MSLLNINCCLRPLSACPWFYPDPSCRVAGNLGEGRAHLAGCGSLYSQIIILAVFMVGHCHVLAGTLQGTEKNIKKEDHEKELLLNLIVQSPPLFFLGPINITLEDKGIF